jgi:phosphoribosylpyrophosphate synthetase
MELLVTLDALRRLARRIAVMPDLYARQDRKTVAPPISAKLVANLITRPPTAC